MYNIYTKTKNQNDPTPPVAPANKKPDFTQYIDPTGEMPTGKFKLEIWLVKNKVLFYKIAVRFLVVFSVVTIAYSMWQMGDYLIFGIDEDALMNRQLSSSVNYAVWHDHFAPAPIEIVTANILAGGTDKIDAFAILANHNEKFVVSFDYYFVVGDLVTDKHSGFLLAGENRPVASLGLSAGSGASIEIVLENIAWHRVDPHQIIDVIGWQQARLDFTVANSQIIPASAEGISATALQFDLTNNSAFGYRQADFYVALMQGETVAALLPLQLSDFASNETRAVDLRSYTSGVYGTDIRVCPLIDIYDSGVYLAPPK
ncbi:MAG: hypothetical protein WCT40_04085 [Candidatus Magasanikbacteria bacterium]|jgi:hypothetical protein